MNESRPVLRSVILPWASCPTCRHTSTRKAGGFILSSINPPSSSSNHEPNLHELFDIFAPPFHGEGARVEEVPATEVPEPYDGLLVHEHHMTVTVERYHGDPVDVLILNHRLVGNTYARQILLTLQGSGRVVQYGVVRIHLQYCSTEVRAEILAGKTPLGRILIQHDVLRRIEPKIYLRVIPGKALMSWFGIQQSRPTYGRLAMIHCNDQPAIELLEIVAPAGAVCI
jgi:chorismate-pyruvate lyase